MKAALAALEEGEDHGLRMYKDDLDKLDTSTRSFVEGELLPVAAAQPRRDERAEALRSLMP